MKNNDTLFVALALICAVLGVANIIIMSAQCVNNMPLKEIKKISLCEVVQ